MVRCYIILISALFMMHYEGKDGDWAVSKVVSFYQIICPSCPQLKLTYVMYSVCIFNHCWV